MSFIRRKILKENQVETFIKEYKKFLLDEKIFTTKDDIEYFFTMGGCYIFARILKKEYPNAKILINDSKTHCKIGLKNKNYDIRGSVFKKFNNNFHEASEDDIKYMTNSFGFNSYTLNNKQYTSKEFDELFMSETLDLFHKTSNINTLGTLIISNKKGKNLCNS